jgi:serine phosphatase RsbU (regulator of sigma subunit)
MYTDGVTEANNGTDDEFTPARPEAAIEAERGADAEQIVRHVLFRTPGLHGRRESIG